MNLLFSDLDGTLLNNGKVEDNDKKAILKYLMNDENLFVIATGRGLDEFLKVKEKHGLVYDYAILSGGALIIDDKDNIILNRSINFDKTKAFLKALYKIMCNIKRITFYTTNKYYEFSNESKIKKFIKKDLDLTSICIEATNKMDMSDIYFYLNKFNLNFCINGTYIDITEESVNKGYAISELKRKLNLEKCNIYAIGDSENDFSMFDVSDISFSFNKANEIVKKRVSIVVDNISECLEIIHNYVENNVINYPLLISNKKIYECKWFELKKSKCYFSKQNVISAQHIIEFPNDSVTAIILNEDREIMCIYPYRFMYKSPKPEIPAGYIEDGETPKEAIIREIYEETGLRVKNGKELLVFQPNNSISEQKIHIFEFKVNNFLKTDEYDKNEIIKSKWIKLPEIKKMIESNIFVDGVTLLALTYWFMFNDN